MHGPLNVKRMQLRKNILCTQNQRSGNYTILKCVINYVRIHLWDTTLKMEVAGFSETLIRISG
jgi:hypothetical protein